MLTSGLHQRQFLVHSYLQIENDILFKPLYVVKVLTSMYFQDDSCNYFKKIY